MRKIIVTIGLVAIAMMTQLISCDADRRSGVDQTKQIIAKDITALKDYITDSLLPDAGTDTGTVLQERFLRTRSLYKRIEWATEYFMSTTTRFVNGPPLPEIENEENKLTEPEGLQVIEELVYSNPNDHVALTRYSRLLMSRCTYYQNYWNDLAIDSSQIFDALRLEMFRINSLSISGFDAPLALSSLSETIESLEAIESTLQIFDTKNEISPLIQKAIGYISANNNFLAFDRLTFIKDHSQPITKAIVALQKQIGLAFVNDDRLLRPSAATLFDEDAFDVNAYVQDPSFNYTDAKAQLGKQLFYDAILSNNGKRSCASCHQPEKAFTDGLVKNVSLTGVSMGRNTPTLLNAALQPVQFYDMRTTNLENQSRDVIHNKDEMHGDLSRALQKIVTDKIYDSLLKMAFPNEKVFKEQHLQNAIGSFVRSLALMNSRFDEFMRYKKGVELSVEEKKGFNLFMGKAKCGTCHFMPLFNGTMPPSFLEMESEVIGVPADKDNKILDKDLGRYNIYKLAPYRNAFKTTTVRNSGLTAPYMHNGVFDSLEEVIEFYNKGGGIGNGIDVPDQTLAPDPLKLDDLEIKAIIAFINTLNDKVDR